MTIEIGEARRRMANEREILGEIKKHQAMPEGLNGENMAELAASRRKTVLSIWALRSIINETEAA